MPENEEIHAYEFQKRPYFFTISCQYFPKKPGRNGNKSPEFRIPGLFHPQKALFLFANHTQIQLSICLYFHGLKNRRIKNTPSMPILFCPCQPSSFISSHFVKPKVQIQRIKLNCSVLIPVQRKDSRVILTK